MSNRLILNLRKFQHHSSNILEVIPTKKPGAPSRLTPPPE